MASDDKKKDKDVDSSLHSSAVRLGSAGGKVGGPKRAESLSAEERSKIASEGGKAKAAKARSTVHKLKSKKKKKGDK